jgi:hypothetical protein
MRWTNRITRGPFWRTLPAEQRPISDVGLGMARRALHDTWLGFAKGAAMVAITLAGLAYASNGVSTATWAKAIRASATQMQASKPMNYRAARLLPTN